MSAQDLASRHWTGGQRKWIRLVCVMSLRSFYTNYIVMPIRGDLHRSLSPSSALNRQHLVNSHQDVILRLSRRSVKSGDAHVSGGNCLPTLGIIMV